MKEYNIEQFADQLEAYLKANLNAKITEINTEFSSLPVELKTVDADAYFFQTLDDRVANFDPILYYETGNPTLNEGIRGSIIETYNFLVLLCYQSDGADLHAGKKLARYNRALKELAIEICNKFRQANPKISSVEPAGYAFLNSTQQARATGLQIEVTFNK